MDELHRRRVRLPWIPTLVVAVAALLGIQALLSILGALSTFLGRFSQAFFLFVVGAIGAYVMLPAVDWVQRWLRRKLVAIFVVYLVLALTALALGVLFFAPFVQQGEDLMRALRPPPPESTQTLSSLQTGARQTYSALLVQQDQLSGGSVIPQSDIEQTTAQIRAMQQDLADLERDSTSGPAASPLAGLEQVGLPPSYLTSISTWLSALASTYSEATANPRAVSRPLLDQSVTAARSLLAVCANTARIVSSTPVLVLGLQSRLDARGIKVDLHRQFGNILSELSKQALSILKRLVGLVSSVGTLLVNSLLVLIIAFYFLIDGRKMVDRSIALVPGRQREGAAYFVSNFDHLMGEYIRGHLLLAGLSAGLAGVGTWLLGVPYPVPIAFCTFALSLIPLIGPVILVVPPVVIALVFTSMPTPLWLLLYFLVFMQVVTNVIGPRVMSSAVGIHPLEVLAAALIGFPLGGILGSFFAVPIVAFLHLVAEEAHRQFFQSGEPRPGDEPDVEVQPVPAAVSSASRSTAK